MHGFITNMPKKFPFQDSDTVTFTKDSQGNIFAHADGGGSVVSDSVYSSGWDGVTTIAPSKNAVYDKIESLTGSGGPSRGVVSFTTASLANNATESGSFSLGKTSEVIQVAASAKVRIRFYSTSAGRDSDLSRAYTDKAAWNSGLLLELYLSETALLTFAMQPPATVSNLDGTVVATIYYNVTNISGSSAAITVDVTRLLVEES